MLIFNSKAVVERRGFRPKIFDDDYVVQYSIDNLAYSDLFTISSSYGNLPVSPGGMDTMTTIAGDPEYVPEINFIPVEARYLRSSEHKAMFFTEWEKLWRLDN